MTDDRLSVLLRELPVPSAASARERVVTAAREHIEARAGATRPRPPLRSRRHFALVLAACFACLVGVSLLTPPGQAAIERVGRLLGVGQVGGPPTLHPRLKPANAAIVIDDGRAPDGTRYEWSAYRSGQRHEGGPTGARSQMCVGLDWPAVPARGRPLACGQATGPLRRAPLAAGDRISDGFGVGYVQSRAERSGARDLMLWGIARPGIERLRIRYRDTRGRSHEVPVDFARIDGPLLRRTGARPFAVFVAFLTADQVARVRLPRDPGAITYAAAPPPASAYPKRLPKACRDIRAPDGPFEFIAYDRPDHLLTRARTIVTHRAPAACVRAMRKLTNP